MKNTTKLGQKIKPLIWLKVGNKNKGKNLYHEKIILKSLGQCLCFENTILPPLPLTLLFLSILALTFLLTFREHLPVAQRKMFSQPSSLLLRKRDCNRLACRAQLVESLAESIYQFNDKSYSK